MNQTFELGVLNKMEIRMKLSLLQLLDLLISNVTGKNLNWLTGGLF